MNIIKINDTSNKLYYIGGVVRDELLGRKSRDIDITYVGNAIEYCSKFGKVIRENPDFGTVQIEVWRDRGLEVWQFNNTININSQTNNSSVIDFASTRSESYPRKGHLPVVDKIGCSLKEDVMRRDFTVNALAKSVATGEIIDYTGGLEDLKNKKLRVLHDESFIDDPTRIIRGLKFSVRFGFELEEHTKKLQEEYLNNINYDMSYKRVKKELVETFNLNSQLAFEKFINEKIYKLVTPNDVRLPKVNIEKLVEKYILEAEQPRSETAESDIIDLFINGFTFCSSERFSDYLSCIAAWLLSCLAFDNNHTSKPPYLHTSVWLIYVGVLGDLSRLPLTKTEQKILDDVPKIEPKTDFEIYKMFENLRIESILLYAILKNESIVRHYLDDLCGIKIEITGDDLKNLGIEPSPEYQKIFDTVLKEKLKNPNMTKSDELKIVKNKFS